MSIAMPDLPGVARQEASGGILVDLNQAQWLPMPSIVSWGAAWRRINSQPGLSCFL
jgi:hypothetical protein